MEELRIFNSEEFGQIRTVVIDNEPWLCLADICKALELTQPSKVKERLKEKGVRSIPTLTNGGTQNLLYVDEGNLYKTIFQSRKESAEKFSEAAVTSDVLPSIRAHGIYATDNAIDQIMNNPDFWNPVADKTKRRAYRPSEGRKEKRNPYARK